MTGFARIEMKNNIFLYVLFVDFVMKNVIEFYFLMTLFDKL